MNSRDIADIFNHHHSNKDNKGYCDIYHILFDHLKDKSIKLLEIGDINSGANLKAWRDYFINGHIVGCDTNKNSDLDLDVHVCNCLDYMEVEKILKPLGLFDIIINNGKHEYNEHLSAVRNLLPLLNDNGILIIEDIDKENVMLLEPMLIRNIIHPLSITFCSHSSIMCVIFNKPLNSKSQKI
jgi:hypothetical protein